MMDLASWVKIHAVHDDFVACGRAGAASSLVTSRVMHPYFKIPQRFVLQLRCGVDPVCEG